MEKSDEELVAESQQGSLHAFENLVKSYQPRILRFLEKQLNSPEDAQDVTQRTFVQAYRSLPRFNPTYRFAPWLFTIARRQGIDFIRQSGSRRRLQEQLHAESLKIFEDDPSKTLDEKEGIDAIWRWVWSQLDARSSEILWLRIQEELELAEIARIVKLSHNHVKVLLHRARKSLLQNLPSQSELPIPSSVTNSRQAVEL